MVLVRFSHPDGDCYYDDESQEGGECVWVLPPGLEAASILQADTTRDLSYTRRIQKAYNRAVNRRQLSHRAGLESYRKRQYAEARRQFKMAIRWGLDDPDIYQRDVQASLVVWDMDPSEENLQACQASFEQLLEKVPEAATVENLLEVAKIYIHGGSYHQAFDLLKGLRESYPSSPLSSHMLFLMGMILAYLDSYDQCIAVMEHLASSSCQPPYKFIPKDILKLICAWAELHKGRTAHSLGYCEEALNLYQERHPKLDRAHPGFQNPLQFFGNAQVWHEAGDIALPSGGERDSLPSPYKNYLLAKLCYYGALTRGKRDETEYLLVYSCMRHLSITGEGPIELLGRGYHEHRTSLTMRSLLLGLSPIWAEYFTLQDKCVIRLQSWFRMLLAIRCRQRLAEEREFQRRQRRIWQMNVKWELRRALGSYTDRKKKVFKRDFFRLWKDVHSRAMFDQEAATLTLQCFARMTLAKACVRRERARHARLIKAEHLVEEIMRRSLQRYALAGFHYAIWTINVCPHVRRIQLAWRWYQIQQAIKKRRRAALLFLRHSNNLTAVIFRRWHEEARQSHRDRASIQIQRIYRGHRGRIFAKEEAQRCIYRKHFLSTVLHHTFLQIFFSKWYNNSQSDLEAAFVRKIQCAARQKLARLKVQRRRFILEQIVVNDEKRRRRTVRLTFQAFKAPWIQKRRAILATKIQCAVRVFLACRRTQRLRAQREFRERMIELRLRLRVEAIARLALRFWRLTSRQAHAERRCMVVVIQRVYRGHRARKWVKDYKYWSRRRRVNQKKEPKLYAAAVGKANRMSIRMANRKWRLLYSLSLHAARIQALFRGNLERRMVKRIRRQRTTMRAFLAKLVRVHDRGAPLYCLHWWWHCVLQHRAATVIQASYRGRLGRKEAQERGRVWASTQSSLQKRLLWHNRKVLHSSLKWWRMIAREISAAIKCQAWIRRFLVRRQIKRIRAVARTYVPKCTSVGMQIAGQKRRANIILQSAFRREQAYRRARTLSYHRYVTQEEQAATVYGRSKWRALRSHVTHWQAAVQAHRAKVVAVQSWTRMLLVQKEVAKLRARKQRIDAGMAALNHKRRMRAMDMVFHAIEEALVQAVVARVKLDISLKVEPTSPEITNMAEKLRRPIGLPSSKTLDSTLDLLPFLADDKARDIAPDLFSHHFMATKRSIMNSGTLRWSRCQDLTYRERLSLLMIAPVVITDHGHLGDMANCLKCLVAHHQRVVLEKIVFFHTTFHAKEMEEVLTCLKYLMSYLVDHPLEELVLEKNGLHSPGIAGIVRALQARLVIRRLVLDKNVLRSESGGYEVGDLLCNCASLKTLSMVEALGDRRCAHKFIDQAFQRYSQCRLDQLILAGNPCLQGEGAMNLLESVGRLGKSLQESGIDFVSCVDLSCCGLTDETCPAVVRLIQDMGGQSSGSGFRVVLEGNDITATGGGMVVQASDRHGAEVVMSKNPLPFDFVRDTMLFEGRTLTKHLGKLVMADMIMERPISPYAVWNVVPPLRW